MEIVRMSTAHVSRIAELESVCFSTPWSENSIKSELTNPLSLWLVALEENVVVGYIGSQSVLGEADMMNVAVAPEYRRRGIGKQLVCELVNSLCLQQVHCLTLEVRVSNASAIALYEQLGFQQVGIRPRYYSSPKEDALILRKEWEL